VIGTTAFYWGDVSKWVIHVRNNSAGFRTLVDIDYAMNLDTGRVKTTGTASRDRIAMPFRGDLT
jgi:hypothetical protein